MASGTHSAECVPECHGGGRPPGHNPVLLRLWWTGDDALFASSAPPLYCDRANGGRHRRPAGFGSVSVQWRAGAAVPFSHVPTWQAKWLGVAGRKVPPDLKRQMACKHIVYFNLTTMALVTPATC
eukprot:351152-Chlamydomonas_euryale.AAC.3